MASNDTSRYSDFDALVVRHQRLIRSLCWWYADGDAERTADLMQEVLASLWHFRHTLRADATAGQERQWVRLHCRSVFEHLRRRPEMETVPIEEAQQVAADDSTARTAIDCLTTNFTEMEHRVLELVLDGYTDGEIGTVLQVSVDEARLLHAAVIEKMKERAKSS